jgi:hypothetical protein
VAAAERDIGILLIPAGCTGDFQPLDRRVIGELKLRANRFFRKAEIIEGDNKLPRQCKVDTLEQAMVAYSYRKHPNSMGHRLNDQVFFLFQLSLFRKSKIYQFFWKSFRIKGNYGYSNL